MGKIILVIRIEYYVNMRMKHEVKYEHTTGASLVIILQLFFFLLLGDNWVTCLCLYYV